jgi:hypothetical protein
LIPSHGQRITALTRLSISGAIQAWDVQQVGDLLGVLEVSVLPKIRLRATAYGQLPEGGPPEMPARPHSFSKPEEDEE